MIVCGDCGQEVAEKRGWFECGCGVAFAYVVLQRIDELGLASVRLERPLPMAGLHYGPPAEYVH